MQGLRSRDRILRVLRGAWMSGGNLLRMPESRAQATVAPSARTRGLKARSETSGLKRRYNCCDPTNSALCGGRRCCAARRTSMGVEPPTSRRSGAVLVVRPAWPAWLVVPKPLAGDPHPARIQGAVDRNQAIVCVIAASWVVVWPPNARANLL